jgi:hypothetical protein
MIEFRVVGVNPDCQSMSPIAIEHAFRSSVDNRHRSSALTPAGRIKLCLPGMLLPLSGY